MKSLWKYLVIALATLALAFMLGCGGGNDNSGNDGPDPSPTPEPTPSTDPEPAADPTPDDPNAALREMFMGLSEEERAKTLVKGTLQAAHLGKADQDYRVLYYVEPDEILNSYENTKGQIALYVMQYFGIDPSLLSSDSMGKLTDMVGELLKFRKVVIDGVGWNGADKYDVIVKVYPIDTIGLVGSSDIMDAWTAKEELAKTEGAAAAEDSYATAVIELLTRVKSRTDNLDDPLTFIVSVKVGDKEAGEMWITSTGALDDIDKAVIKTEYDDAS